MSDSQIVVPVATVEKLARALAAQPPPAQLERHGGLESLSDEPDDGVRQVVANLRQTLDALRREDRGDGVVVCIEHRDASLLQSFLAEQGQTFRDDLLARERLRPASSGGLEAMYDDHDIAGWVGKFFPAWLAAKFRGKRPFLPPSETVVDLRDGARVAVLGDWGSGLYGAPVSATSILATTPAYDLVLHLGDVYYAGTSDEVRRNFLDVWPRVPGAKHRALNANHEMYSGGEGYFDLTLKDGAFAQSSSCFALQTPRILLLGLDTAYEDHDLSAEQVAWIRRRVAAAEGRKVVLFSHHQPFSQFEDGGEKLVAKLGDLLTERKVFAWYWGHEHRCAIFDRHEPWQLWGRCIGHGGYPAFRDTFGGTGQRNVDGSIWHAVQTRNWPVARVLDGPNEYVKGEAARYAPNGYASLVLDGDRIHEAVHAPNGSVLWKNEIV